VCDLETSRMGAPYIYDISRLRVNTVPGGQDAFFHLGLRRKCKTEADFCI